MDDDNADRETDIEKRANRIRAIAQIQQFIAGSAELRAILGHQLVFINNGLNDAKNALAKNADAAARLQIEPFYAELRSKIMAQKGNRSVRPSIKTLDEWLAWQPVPEADSEWRRRLQVPLTNLRQFVGDLPLPPAVKGQFTRRAKQALASANESEAASRLVEAVADLKQRTKDLSLPEDVRRTLDNIHLE